MNRRGEGAGGLRYLLTLLLLCSSAAGQPAARKVVTAPGGAGQQGLTVEIKGGVALAGACAVGPCPASVDLGVPEGFRGGLGEAELSAVDRKSVV